MANESGIPRIRKRIDEERRNFAEIAINIGIDEPTRYFAQRVLDAFERLDLDLRSLDYAGQHSDTGN